MTHRAVTGLRRKLPLRNFGGMGRSPLPVGMLWAAVCCALPLSAAARGASAGGETKPSPKTIFVMPIEEVGLDESGLATQVADAIAAEIATYSNYSVVTSVEVRDMVEVAAAKRAVACKDDEECLASIQRATQANLIITGSVGRVERDLILTLSLVDSKTAEPLARIGDTASSERELVGRAATAVRRLLGARDDRRVTFELPEKVKFGVFSIEATGVDQETVKTLTQFMLVELSNIRGADVISPDDLQAIIGAEQYKELLGGECDEECMLNISGSLNVNYLVTGLIGRLDRDYVISLRLIDPRRAVVANRISDTVRGPTDELKRAIRTFVRELLGIESKGEGLVAFSGPVAGAEVHLGDEVIGQIPARPQTPFDAGRLSVRVTKGGYYDWESDVFVQPGETNLVWAELERKPRPIYGRWWFWTVLGAAVAGGVTTAVVVAQQTPESGDGVLIIGDAAN